MSTAVIRSVSTKFLISNPIDSRLARWLKLHKPTPFGAAPTTLKMQKNLQMQLPGDQLDPSIKVSPETFICI